MVQEKAAKPMTEGVADIEKKLDTIIIPRVDKEDVVGNLTESF